jgi:IPT/TIG domain
MARSTRSTVILGAATAIALVTAGWFTAGAAVADDTPAPVDTTAPSDSPTTDPTTDPTTPPDAPSDDPAPGAPIVPTVPKPPIAGGYTVPQVASQLAASGSTGGNTFSNPITISGRFPFPTMLDNTSATIQTHEPRRLTGGYYLTRTQWIKWKAPAAATIYVQVYDTNATNDVGVNVFTGSSLTTLKKIASNDQQYLPPDGASTISVSPANNAGILSLNVKKGKNYYFQVGSPAEGTAAIGAIRNNITFWIAGASYNVKNDNLSDAKELKLGPGSTVSDVGLLGGSTMEPWEPYDNDEGTGDPRIGSIWYKWIAPQDGQATFTNCAFLDGGPTIAVFGETLTDIIGGTEYYGDMRHMGFDTGGYGSCSLFYGGGSVATVPVFKGERFYIQTAETQGQQGGRDITTSISGTFSLPYINTLSRKSGKVGNTVVITGQQLTTGGAPVVKFGTRTATIVGTPTATSITVKVPNHGAGYTGKIKVTVKAGSNLSNTASFTYKL